MKTKIQEAKRILGADIIKVFEETFGEDPRALEEIMEEAVRAMKLINQDSDYDSFYDNSAMEALRIIRL